MPTASVRRSSGPDRPKASARTRSRSARGSRGSRSLRPRRPRDPRRSVARSARPSRHRSPSLDLEAFDTRRGTEVRAAGDGDTEVRPGVPLDAIRTSEYASAAVTAPYGRSHLRCRLRGQTELVRGSKEPARERMPPPSMLGRHRDLTSDLCELLIEVDPERPKVVVGADAVARRDGRRPAETDAPHDQHVV